MSIFLKAIACVLVCVVLSLALSKQAKDFSMLLAISGCCIVLIGAISFLKPVIEFFRKLQLLCNLDSDMYSVLLKTVGIGLLAEVTELICIDSGNAALGKGLKILATSVILWMSIPLLSGLISLIEEILVSV